MCSVVDYKPELKIATEDIVCYKSVYVKKKSYLFGLIKRYKIKSTIKGFKYKLNKLYKTKLCPFRRIVGLYYSDSGFYSYKNNNNCEVKCVIPKGSKYYLTPGNTKIGFYEEIYISDKIKIVEILK